MGRGAGTPGAEPCRGDAPTPCLPCLALLLVLVGTWMQEGTLSPLGEERRPPGCRAETLDGAGRRLPPGLLLCLHRALPGSVGGFSVTATLLPPGSLVPGRGGRVRCCRREESLQCPQVGAPGPGRAPGASSSHLFMVLLRGASGILPGVLGCFRCALTRHLLARPVTPHQPHTKRRLTRAVRPAGTPHTLRGPPPFHCIILNNDEALRKAPVLSCRAGGGQAEDSALPTILGTRRPLLSIPRLTP